MKSLILVAIVLFGGCSQFDGLYNEVAKPVYSATKAVGTVAIKDGIISDSTATKLKIANEAATTYDKVRTVVREGKQVDVNISSTSMESK